MCGWPADRVRRRYPARERDERFREACAAADKGNANTSRKGARLLGRASKKLAKLGKKIGKAKVAKKLPGECGVAARAFFVDLQSRVDALRAAR